MIGPRHASAIVRLENELEREDDPTRRKKDIVDELRDIARDEADEERWLDEGYERGWR